MPPLAVFAYWHSHCDEIILNKTHCCLNRNITECLNQPVWGRFAARYCALFMYLYDSVH